MPHIDPLRFTGEVVELRGLLIESTGPAAAVGDFCEILSAAGRTIRVQVVGFRNGRILSMPLEETDGLRLGDTILARPHAARVAVGPQLLGRVLDGFGSPWMVSRPIEADGDIRTLPQSRKSAHPVPHHRTAGHRNSRDRRHAALRKGPAHRDLRRQRRRQEHPARRHGPRKFGGRQRDRARSANAIAKCARSSITNSDDEGPKRSVVVAATSDRPALLRVRACFVALAVAEYFRDQGKNVLLVMDSATRLAMAQREIGLASGEPPSQKGYTPSVFALLPKVCERAGNFQNGSITGFFTVLVEGDDFNEPICDAVRAILDGHIILSRQLGAAGHYPAIQVLDSVSRLQSQLATQEQKENMRKIREALAAYHQAEDLIQLGAYVAGTNPGLDASIKARPGIIDFLRQDAATASPLDQTLQQLGAVAAQLP